MSEKKRLTEKDCYEYFKEYKTPAHVIAHCQAVSSTAETIAKELNKHGFSLDTELIKYSGLIHDKMDLK